MFMPFFEIPNWWLNNTEIKDQLKCDPDIYPTSGIPKWPEWWSSIIEIIWLIVMLWFTFFRRAFRLLSASARVREIIQAVLTLLALIDIVVAIIFGYGVFLGNFIRIIIIVDMIRGLREAIKRMWLVLYDSKEIMSLIFANVILFGWIGFRLFRGTAEGEMYFPTMLEGIWNLFILMTTANFPDVMLPAYSINKAYALFFIFYLVIGTYFLLYLVLATFYSNYKNRVERTIDKFEDIRENFLLSKFKEYDTNNNGFLTLEELTELITELIGAKIRK